MSPLAKHEKAQLLALARSSIIRRVVEGRFELQPAEGEELLRPSGAFVTLHLREELRGCIGRIRSPDPLYQIVQEMAVAAAIRDPRFSPVQVGEIPALTVEISVLSPPTPLVDIGEIRVGTHGLIVGWGGQSGLLLPQVATEYGWDAETFLAHTCMKAGFPTDFWKHPSAKIEIFSAEVFSEREALSTD